MQYLKSGKGAFASNTPTTGTCSIPAASSASQPRQNVYSYYCKDNGSANQALNAFRSLLSQLLKDHTDLCPDFDSQVQEQKKHGHRPTSNPKLLKDLLIDLVVRLQQPTFFIIDALDECSPNDRSVLLEFLEQVCSLTTHTRVLTSCRAASDLYSPNDLVSPGAVLICSWKLSLPQRDQRDREIAKFLVEQKKKLVSEEVCKLLEDTLASRMNGCAVWARMTLEYLCFGAPGRCASIVTLRSCLEKNELPDNLTQLYIGVFENLTHGDRVARWLLARSLELIAGAQWRLTFDELLSALSLYTPPSKNGVPRTTKNLAELRRNLSEELNETWIRQLLRPFAGFSSDLEPTVGFVHQSMKDAVLEFPRALTDAAAQSTVGGGIEGVMLRTCVDYLLLDDFGRTETIPDDKWHNRAGARLQNNERYGARASSGCDGRRRRRRRQARHSGNSLTEPSKGSNTDPFGAFFHYAARNWTDHLGSAPVNFSLDDFLEVASPTSAKHRAWALESRYRRQGFFGSSPGAKEGPLCLLVHNGNASTLEQLLGKLALNADDSEDRRLIVAAASVAIHQGPGQLGNFRALMNHPSTKKAVQTVELLEKILKMPFYDHGRKEWTKLFADLFDMMASDTIHSPNYLLEKACTNLHCMPAIEKIFERARTDPDPAFQERLMQPTNGVGPLGAAILQDDVAAFRYMCQRDGIEAHASNRDDDGNLLALCCCCCCCCCNLEIIELLLDKFPWLVTEREGGEMALDSIFDFGPSTPDWVETAKRILQHPKANPGLVDEVDKFLFRAVQVGWPEMCQMLISDTHADARTVVKMSSSGRLELKEHCLRDRPHEKWRTREPDEKVLEAITACLSAEVLEEMTT